MKKLLIVVRFGTDAEILQKTLNDVGTDNIHVGYFGQLRTEYTYDHIIIGRPIIAAEEEDIRGMCKMLNPKGILTII